MCANPQVPADNDAAASDGAPLAGLFSPADLARALGKAFDPTPEQQQVISGPLQPTLVAAGAGAGKTETMAARVVYLVANGYARPEEILGLTFSRKAARELEDRIRLSLEGLKSSGLIDPRTAADHPRLRRVLRALDDIALHVHTYDSFAGQVLGEFGLLLPVETSSQVITDAQQFVMLRDIVRNYQGTIEHKTSLVKVIDTVKALSDNLDNSVGSMEFLREWERDFLASVAELPPARANIPYSKDLLKIMAVQQERGQLLPLVSAYRQRLQDNSQLSFGRQMALAAQLAATHPSVGASLRSRYKVVLLDEYQDTSQVQRILLRSLFSSHSTAGGAPESVTAVTAVGDPMQSIYSWRGAASANFAAFPTDFALSAPTPQHPAAAQPESPQPAPPQPAAVMNLRTSWRNPAGVLELANALAREVLSPEEQQLVSSLQAPAGAREGEIELNYFPAAQEEDQRVVDQCQQLLTRANQQEEPLSVAILVRTNSDAAHFATVLRAAEIPCEVIGVGGLVNLPEIRDLVAVATVLIRPQDNQAALRLLSGPLCGIGLRDIRALHRRARHLSHSLNTQQQHRPEEAADPLARLDQEIAQVLAQGPEQVVGLADALADMGPRSDYTEAGGARIAELSARLRYLRRYSLSKSLSDLFADIENIFGFRTELLAAHRQQGTANLDRFANYIAQFPGGQLAAFVDYVELVRDHEQGLPAQSITAPGNRVVIMTIHKAKGLEFDHVIIPRVDSQTYSFEARSAIRQVEQLPEPDDEIDPYAFLAEDAEEPTRTDFYRAAKALVDLSREAEHAEVGRLFYVALTRAKRSLLVSGSGTNNRKGAAQKGPLDYFSTLAEKFPHYIGTWSVPQAPVEDPTAPGQSEPLFPALAPDSAVVAAAYRVDAARSTLPALQSGELYHQWERDTSAIIAEYEALSAPEVIVELPSELTASDIVSLQADPEEFARRKRRPVPFKPNAFAKRGTAFHLWLEEQFGAPPLLDEEYLFEPAEETVELAQLKEAFARSQWAHRRPVEVEYYFEFSAADTVIRGRMDAVYRQDDGSWLIIDWKTGQVPTAAQRDSRQLQLAVYAEAWRRLHPADEVRAAFYYVAADYLYEPPVLARGEQLEALLRNAGESGWLQA